MLTHYRVKRRCSKLLRYQYHCSLVHYQFHKEHHGI